MILTLKNFRCYENATFDFGESGLTLISGESGIGKSSLLIAIKYVLFGKVPKVVQHGKTTCSVTLTINDMTITRSNRPNKLTVDRPKMATSIDDDAQEVINKLFGESFDMIGYIEQNSINTFILLSPIEKLGFLEKFAFKDVDLVSLKKKCKDYIKECNESLIDASAKVETSNKMLNDKYPDKTIFNNPPSYPLNCNAKNRSDFSAEECLNYKKCNNSIIKNKKSLIELRSEYTELIRLNMEIKANNDNINNEQIKRKRLVELDKSIIYKGDSYLTDCVNQLTIINNNTKRQSELEKELEDLSRLNFELNIYEQHIKTNQEKKLISENLKKALNFKGVDFIKNLEDKLNNIVSDNIKRDKIIKNLQNEILKLTVEFESIDENITKEEENKIGYENRKSELTYKGDDFLEKMERILIKRIRNTELEILKKEMSKLQDMEELEKAGLKKEIQMLKDELWNEFEESDIESEIEDYNTMLQDILIIEKLKNELLGYSTINKDDLIKLQQQVISIEYSEIYKCPSCKSDLVIKDNELIVSCVPRSSLPITKNKTLILKEISEMEYKLKCKEKIEKDLLKIEGSYDDELPPLSETKEQYEYLIKYNNDQNDMIKKITNLENNLECCIYSASYSSFANDIQIKLDKQSREDLGEETEYEIEDSSLTDEELRNEITIQQKNKNDILNINNNLNSVSKNINNYTTKKNKIIDTLKEKKDTLNETISNGLVDNEISTRELVNYEKQIFETYTKYESEIKQINNEINIFITKGTDLKTLHIKQYNIVKTNVAIQDEIKSMTTSDDGVVGILPLTRIIDKETKLKSEKKDVTRRIVEIDNDISNYETKNKDITVKYLKKYDEIKNETKLAKDITTIEYDIIERENEQKNHESNLSQIAICEKYENELNQYNKWVNNIKDLENNEKTIELSYNKSMTLKDKILETESVCLYNVINSINTHVQLYLDLFFIDNPITIELLSFKETKTKVKPQINLKIDYKGMDCDLSMLSGGELSRVILAFTLALSEMFNVPLLMIDETTSSLDQELTTQVFSSIKENFKDKLVLLIAHQVVEGSFDKVITL